VFSVDVRTSACWGADTNAVERRCDLASVDRTDGVIDVRVPVVLGLAAPAQADHVACRRQSLSARRRSV
jgi:hypothetical protein